MKKVKYVDNYHSALLQGKVYEVIGENKTEYLVYDEDNEQYWYDKTDFEVVDHKLEFVKCNCEEGRCGDLTIGKVYEVIGRYDEEIQVIDDAGDYYWYDEEVFEEMKEEGETQMKASEILQNRAEELKKELALVEEEIIKAKKEERGIWIPKLGETYYVAGDGGDVTDYENDNDSIDEEFIANLNVFRTEEEAQREVFEILLRRRLQRFAKENNDEIIDWHNARQAKYYIYYDYKNEKLSVCDYGTVRDFGTTAFFTSHLLAQKAIEAFESDLLRYFESEE